MTNLEGGGGGSVPRRPGRPKRLDGRSTAEARYTIPDTLLPQLERLAHVRGESRDAVVTGLLAASITDLAIGSVAQADKPVAMPPQVQSAALVIEDIAERVASDVEVQVGQAVERQVDRLRDEMMEGLAEMIEERITGRIEHVVNRLASLIDERDRRAAETVLQIAQLASEISSVTRTNRAVVERVDDNIGLLVSSTRTLSGNIRSVLELLARMTGISLERKEG